jgi:hypothetical protein
MDGTAFVTKRQTPRDSVLAVKSELVIIYKPVNSWLARWDGFRTLGVDEKICELVGSFV